MTRENGTVRIESLWRYPVKSMQGETCDELRIDWTGVLNDRGVGVLDLDNGTILSAKREGRLLQASASLTSSGLEVTLPDGRREVRGGALDEELSRWLGRRVALVDAVTHGTGTFEAPDDFEDDASPLHRWRGPAESFVDSSSLHLLERAELTRLIRERPELQWDVRRFRPNIVVDSVTSPVDWAVPGTRLRLGGVDIEVEKGCARCVMTTRAQPGDLARQLDILRHVSAVHGNDLGVLARVLSPGVVRVGDPLEVLH